MGKRRWKGCNSMVAAAILLLLICGSASAQNSISGIVFDPNRRPANDINVELLDSFERLIASRKTKGSGFFTFQRLNQGVYYIRVRVAGTNFKDQKKRIDLGDLNSLGGVDQKQIEIYLEFDPRAVKRTPAVTGVIFAQDVPDEARRLFETAGKYKKKKRPEDAEKALIQATSVFPDYFQALEMLGDVHLELKKYRDAEADYLRAVRVNPKCFACLLNLAMAQYNLKELEKAVGSLVKANELDSSSINAHLLLGIVQRELKRYENAEKSFLVSKKLGENKYADVNWQLATLYYFDLGKKSEAADELERYLKNLSGKEKKKHADKIRSVRKLIQKIRREAKEAS